MSSSAEIQPPQSPLKSFEIYTPHVAHVYCDEKTQNQAIGESHMKVTPNMIISRDLAKRAVNQ